MKLTTAILAFSFLLMSPSSSYAGDMKIPALPKNPATPEIKNINQPGTAQHPISNSTPIISKKKDSKLKNKKKLNPSPLFSENININNDTESKKTPLKDVAPEKIRPNLSRFTNTNGLPHKKVPLIKNINYNKPSLFRQKATKSNKLHDTNPIIVMSGKGTHNLNGSGIYQNIIVMDENIKQIFSSKKLSVEIRGPVAMLRFPSISGSEIDVQIITTSFRVETFVFNVDNKLQAQKFIVKKENTEKKEKKIHKKNNGGQAIDTLISIANGKKPHGYKWIASEAPRREYMGLGIREIGSYRNMNKEFIIFAITNETTAIITVKEWDLHNSIVLGSVKRARHVKLMSLDSYQIKSGKTIIMYVGIQHPRKGDL